MRVEGNYWNAYYALPGTLEGAQLLGSIAMRFVMSQTRKAIFMELMQDSVSAMLEEIIGQKPEWRDEPQPAPEHERTKE